MPTGILTAALPEAQGYAGLNDDRSLSVSGFINGYVHQIIKQTFVYRHKNIGDGYMCRGRSRSGIVEMEPSVFLYDAAAFRPSASCAVQPVQRRAADDSAACSSTELVSAVWAVPWSALRGPGRQAGFRIRTHVMTQLM